MDEMVFSILSSMRLANVTLIELADIESQDLLAVKPGRSRGEYCWTLTSFLIGHILNKLSDGQRATYLDADLYILKNPRPIFMEMEAAGKSVLITEHDYSPQYDMAEVSGRFCVQFMPFQNNSAGWKVLKWWQDRCLEWCFSYPEPGRFGDQKYLDQWPLLFANETHILTHNEYCQAPWNAQKHSDEAAIFFHMHGLRLYGQGWVRLWFAFKIPKTHYRIYDAYLVLLRRAIAILSEAAPCFVISSARLYPTLRARLSLYKARLFGLGRIDKY